MPEARAKGGAKHRVRSVQAATPAKPSHLWMYVAGVAAVLLVAFVVYGPALGGPFVFDDNVLPYHVPGFSDNISHWVSGVRPVLMLTYWVNYELSNDPSGFHVFNVLVHAFNTVLIFFIVRKFVDGATRDLLAGFAAAVFLLHPIQTEAVAYIVGRSESLSVLFFLSAFTVFLYRRTPAASWKTAIAIFALFFAAAATKEHTLVLPALLLLTDFYWNPGFSLSGARRNWRIYGPIAVAAAAGVIYVSKRVLAFASSAGFGVKEFTWYQYFFTECRAFFVYLRLLVLPVGQDLDWDFPISHNILEHGAIFAVIALLAMIGAAIYYRRRYPLASYGFFVYLLLLVPTSSFIPIKDPIAEHRLYLPMIGILLVMTELLRHIRALDRRQLAAVLGCVALVLAVLAFQRNKLWADPIALWEDTARESPNKPRAHFQLAYAYYAQGRCADAQGQYAMVARIEKPTHNLLIDWALACECNNQPERALKKLKDAAALDATAHVYSQMGMVYAKQSQWEPALRALAKAEQIDPNYPATYYYRGGVRAKTNDFAGAVADYQHALTLDPDGQYSQAVRQGLAYAQQQLSLHR